LAAVPTWRRECSRQMVRSMEEKEATLIVQTAAATYTLPASESISAPYPNSSAQTFRFPISR
jgi:hypothetical protein